MSENHKFGWLPNPGTWERYNYLDIFAAEKTSGLGRLVLAPSANHVSFMIDLIRLMPEPFWILYVLVVPRGGGVVGRYETLNSVARKQTEEFLRRFKDFFENDGRHNLWVGSITSPDLLVYDKHNVIYAYGRLSDFEAAALNLGLSRVDAVRFPSPHSHGLHAEFDQDEQDLLRYWDWKRAPLQDGDD